MNVNEPEKPLPSLTPEQIKELLDRGRKIRKALQARLKPLLNVDPVVMMRRKKSRIG